MLTELEKRIDEQNGNFNKELENYKRTYQTEEYNNRNEKP